MILTRKKFVQPVRNKFPQDKRIDLFPPNSCEQLDAKRQVHCIDLGSEMDVLGEIGEEMAGIVYLLRSPAHSICGSCRMNCSYSTTRAWTSENLVKTEPVVSGARAAGGGTWARKGRVGVLRRVWYLLATD